MAATSASRSLSTLARRTLAVGATAAVALIALAVPASAHTGKPDADCVGEKTVLSIKLVAYQVKPDDKTPNSVTAVEVVDGKEKVILEEKFGTSFHTKKDDFDPTMPHTFVVRVEAWDDPNGKHGWTKEFPPLKVPACKKDTKPPTSSTTKTTTTTTTTTEAPPATTTTTTEAPVGANANLAATGASIAIPIAIGGLLLVGGATMLVILRRRRRA